MILYLFLIAFGIRLISLFISIRNEKRLKMDGATEYGKTNSLLLTLSHIAFYSLCLYEGLHNDARIINLTYFGIVLFAFSMIMLFLVIKQLGAIWTVKLIIAKGHKVNKSMIFKYIRHPNYFLNVIPELVAIAMICQAWTVLMFGLPIYLIPLTIRIVQEEKIMKAMVKDY